MEIYQAIILGIVQGLTELLPISSSAHLNILPWIFKWDFIPDSFDIALHFGTLLAIGIFFFKDWLKLIKGGFLVAVKFVKEKFKAKEIKKVEKEDSTNGRMFWYLVAATIPGGLLGLLADKFLSDILEKEWIIATALIVMGIILYIVDKKSKSETDYENMSFKQTFLVGLSQALAFIPGVSRSGATMTTARLLKVDRSSAAKYSFMLSAPIVLGATLYKLSEFVFDIPFVIGVFTSFLVGIVVIKFLLKYLQKGSFKIFAIYRVIFGLLILGIYFFR